MITVRHCLLPALLCLPLALPAAVADSWTVYPTTQMNCTGYTDHAVKNDGPILIYGGATTGTVRKGSGYLKFDVSAIPDGTAIGAIEWHYFVNEANFPYWSVTPLATDPASLAGTPELLWDDLEAEAHAGYYNYLNEPSTYDPGWKSVFLGGTASYDLTALLASGQDWFAFGGVSRDGSPDFHQEIDGHTGPNVPYLVVHDDTPPPPPCWDAVLIAPVPGTSSYSGSTAMAEDDFNCTAPCVGGLDHAGGDVLYRLDLPEGYQVCAALNQSTMDWNGGLYMFTECLDENGSCVAGASGWLAGGEDETFCYTAPVSETCYIVVDSRTSGGAGTFSLDVDVSSIAAPSDLTCAEEDLGEVSLAWTNNDLYASVEVYEDSQLVATLAGTADTFTHLSVEQGYHCYSVCAVVGTNSECSDDCCLIVGYDNVEILWDFEPDDGGFIVVGTAAWEWGPPIDGSCHDTAEGNVWATDLDAGYVNDACWLLDSGEIWMGEKGGFICIDHCYDSEDEWDGGVVWFTTDDHWYHTFEPLDGTDGTITASAGCSWVVGRSGFTGDSGGWVTDCWDLSDPMWADEVVKIRFAFGSDSSVAGYPGWMIDNITIYNNWYHPQPPLCYYTVTPLSGTVPFQTVHRITCFNNLVGGAVWTRRFAVRIAVTIANGTHYNPWRAGYTNIAPANSFFTQFPLTIPALGTVIGHNTFVMRAMDVTPPPYNQPPYPPSGDSNTMTSIVVANAP